MDEPHALLPLLDSTSDVAKSGTIVPGTQLPGVEPMNQNCMYYYAVVFILQFIVLFMDYLNLRSHMSVPHGLLY